MDDFKYDANRLEFLRNRKNLYGRDVAKILGVSDSMYSRWEKGKDSIPTDRLIQLADFYEVNVDYILSLTDKKKTVKPVPFNKELVAQRTKEIRLSMNMSLRDMEKFLNTTNSTWDAYELGYTVILGAFIPAVCKKSGISADYLLGRSNNKKLS